ncbi:MAG: hemY [Frankiales bacterium]|nr:hemY [Frankiales bacterium]
MADFAVVGGGISGLAAARRLSELRPHDRVLLLEAADRTGGKLRRVEIAGVSVDVGAEAMLARRPEGLALAGSLGLAADVIQPSTGSALLRNRGTNKPLPARTLMGIPTDLDAVRAAGVLSAGTLDRLVAEQSEPHPVLSEDISVGDLVAQRLGHEVVDRLVDPLLGGVYAGRADQISLQAAVPALASRLAADGGSLIMAAAASVAAGAREPITNRQSEPAPPVFASYRGGLARLAELAGAGLQIRTNTAVRHITRSAGGFRLVLGSAAHPEELLVDGVIVATPAPKTALLLAELAPAAAAELATIETASVVIVTLAFRPADLAALPPGSGILVPEVEGSPVKAMTFSSQKWPISTAAGDDGGATGVATLRASFGRAGDERTLQFGDAELVAQARRELATITGVAAAPLDAHVQRWGGALPQYAVGHPALVARVFAAVATVPGLAVCGAAYNGVGIPACIASAQQAADRVSTSVARSAQ